MHELTWLWKVPMELVTSRPSAVGLLEFRAVSRDDDDAWRAVDAILAESFRGNSYRGVAEFRHVFPISAQSSPVFYPSLIGAYLDGELVSFACMEYFMAERVWYMWFMATKAEFQSKGIGRALVEHVQEKSFGLFDQPGASTLGVVAECEAPTSDAVANDATRRVEFYEKCGFLRANVDVPLTVEPRLPIDPYIPLIRLHDTRNAPEGHGLACAGSAQQCQRLVARVDLRPQGKARVSLFNRSLQHARHLPASPAC